MMTVPQLVTDRDVASPRASTQSRLYWNNPFGAGRWRRAERHFLSRWLSSGNCVANFSSPEL
jgi:hypothetical protein